MNYDDHLDRYEEKQRELEAQAAEAARRRDIALQEAMKEADGIIHATILPELERLHAALVRHGIPARISCRRDVSELSPDSSLDIEVELREDIHPDNPRRGITFSAIPAGKYFTVRLVTSQSHAAKPSLSDMKFEDITPSAVEAVCGRFLQQAFPG
ncbi:MAG: hypothetical protein LLG20_22700 [Acidobacteriales bacterium]|nr:hypothetical protein [Terriglobales bacterium]